MVIPGNFATILFGVIFAVMIHVPIFDFLQGAKQNWLLLTNILLILGSLSVPLIFLPRGRIYQKLLADAIQRGEVTRELKSHLDDKEVKTAHQFEIILLVGGHCPFDGVQAVLGSWRAVPGTNPATLAFNQDM